MPCYNNHFKHRFENKREFSILNNYEGMGCKEWKENIEDFKSVDE
jgi:hypothetical protein